MDFSKVLYLTFLYFVTAFANSCGYKGCHPVKPSVLNIHLVAHTHDDVGWLKTVDQYYYGSNQEDAPFGVQYILDSVISELLRNKNRRFVYVESSFLWRWWGEQDSENQDLVKMLVKEGRLQLLNGGWCMSDEATPHYSALIDQMTLGLKFLNETFGECGVPKVAWQIDPFGHSAEVALEFAEMGYDGLFFGRIDHEDYEKRQSTREMETIWRPDTRTGEAGELFSGLLYNLYMPPSGFCFDFYCNAEPIMDNPKLHGYNVNERVSQFVDEVRVWTKAYKTNHVMVTMGGDFNYVVASSWFKNMDKLIKYVNQKYNDVNVLYSTPACYLKALHEENVTWPVKDNDDFFPYGSDAHSYWTGYFTSRPTFKYMVYKGNNLLQAAKQLRIPLGSELAEEQILMQRAISISQHHDAVSGTEKQHVTDDYALYIHEGIDACQKIFTSTYRKWLGADLPEQNFCRLSNISQCEISEYSSRFVVTVYNPLAHPTAIPVRIPVTVGTYTVTGPSGSEISSELVPVPEAVKTIPGRQGKTTLELLFVTEPIPPLGLLSFHIDKIVPVTNNTNNIALPMETSQELPKSEDVIVDNGMFKLRFKGSNGFLDAIERQGETWLFQQNFFYYEPTTGFNYDPNNRASGAYVFRPSSKKALALSNYANISVFRGKNVIEVHQDFNSWVSQIIRLYQGQDQIEFQWLVGPIPVDQDTGKEIITCYKTQLLTDSTWYTDSNGRRLMRRIRNHRQSWNLTLTEPIASNYYPITSAAVILDNRHRLTILTDRPQGAASLQDGEIEIMVYRRLLRDDNMGVEEPLWENQFNRGLVARGTHILQFSKSYENNITNNNMTETNTDERFEIYKFKEGAENHRLEAQKLLLGPWSSFTSTNLSATEWNRKYKMKYGGLLREPLPENIHLLTLERWDKDSLLIRLEHIFEVHEHPTLSKDINVSLKTLLADYDIVNAVELTLGANQEKSKVQRLHWNHVGKTVETHKPPLGPDLIVNLQPMDIRTFQLFVVPRQTS